MSATAIYKKNRRKRVTFATTGAEDANRTRDLQITKLLLYRLSYSSKIISFSIHSKSSKIKYSRQFLQHIKISSDIMSQ